MDADRRSEESARQSLDDVSPTANFIFLASCWFLLTRAVVREQVELRGGRVEQEGGGGEGLQHIAGHRRLRLQGVRWQHQRGAGGKRKHEEMVEGRWMAVSRRRKACAWWKVTLA